MRLAIVCVVLLYGCASSPADDAKLRPVPPHRVFAFAQHEGGTVPVVFKRDRGLAGSACPNTVLVGGVSAAELNPGEVVTLYLPAGDQVIGVKRPGGLCGGRMIELSANIKDGSRFRMGVDGMGDLAFGPTAF